MYIILQDIFKKMIKDENVKKFPFVKRCLEWSHLNSIIA